MSFETRDAPLILGTFKNPAESPMMAPPGKVNFGIDCHPPSFKARAPYAMHSPPSSKSAKRGWCFKRYDHTIVSVTI